jgi:hypothetical protein
MEHPPSAQRFTVIIFHGKEMVPVSRICRKKQQFNTNIRFFRKTDGTTACGHPAAE